MMQELKEMKAELLSMDAKIDSRVDAKLASQKSSTCVLQ
jgi:hypothetical protein